MAWRCLVFTGLILATAVSQADDLRLVSSWPGTLRGIAKDAVLQSGKAYLAMGSGGLAIYDLADPSNPRRVGEIYRPGDFATRRVVVEGSRAVTLGLDGTLTGIDIADPTQPRRVSSTQRWLSSQTLDLREGLTVCHAWDSERQQATFEVWDLFREQGAERRAVVDVATEIAACAFGGPRVLVGVGSTKTYAYDASDWTRPVLAGTAEVGRFGFRSSSQGAWVLLDYGPFTLLNFDRPSAPTILTAVGNDGWIWRTTWAGGVVWGIASDALYRFTPGDAGPIPEPYPLDPRYRSANLVAGDEGLLLIGTISGEIDILTFAATGAPVPRGKITEFGDVSRVKVSGGIAYVAQGNGTRILDVSNPTQMKSVGFLPAVEAETARTDVDVRGSRLLTVESQYQGPTSVWTNSSASTPVLLQSISPRTSGAADREPRYVRWVSDDTFYVAGRDRVTVFNRDPVRGWFAGLAAHSSVGDLADLGFDGSRTLYLAGAFGVQAFPYGGGVPEVVLKLPAEARGVTATGAYAYVACETAGLVIVEASNPMALRVAGTVSTLAPARGVTVRLPYIFVATGEGGIEVFDGTDVTHPRRVAAFDTPGEAQSIELAGNLLYVADGAAGVAVLEYLPARRSQEIALPPLFDRDYQGPAFRVPATSNSGLPVTLRVVSGPAVVEGDVCRPTGQSGAVFLRAEQPGNDEFAPAVVEGRFDFPFLKRDLVQIWINRFYPACPPALASRAGDPDGDGFNNEAEHFLGTDPMVANADRRLPIPRLEGEGAERFVEVEWPVQPDPVVVVDWTRLLTFRTDLGSNQRRPIPSAWVIPQWDRVVVKIPATASPEIGVVDAGFLQLKPL